MGKTHTVAVETSKQNRKEPHQNLRKEVEHQQEVSEHPKLALAASHVFLHPGLRPQQTSTLMSGLRTKEAVGKFAFLQASRLLEPARSHANGWRPAERPHLCFGRTFLFFQDLTEMADETRNG